MQPLQGLRPRRPPMLRLQAASAVRPESRVRNRCRPEGAGEGTGSSERSRTALAACRRGEGGGAAAGRAAVEYPFL